jgi:conjugative relaxase-like TrwC/TraI family protein
MVGVTKIGPRNANYWIEAVAEGGEDYYTKPGEAQGEWMGALAGELGLEGAVDRDAYAAVLAGKHPGTGQVLVSRPQPRKFTDAEGRERRLDPILGYDVRFAAPKSVSLLYAVGSPEVRAAVLRAHDRAVAEGVSYLERRACFVQRGRGGKRIEPGAGFVAMAFRHRSSRAGDPALHTHLVTSNMTRAASDGRWLSLAAPKGRTPFWLQAKAAGHVYQAALRAQLTRELGLEWQAPHNGYADLAVIGRPAIEHFSRRRAEILAALAERGLSSPAAAAVAAYRTREAKDYGVDPDAQRAEWIARAAEFDLTPASIDRMAAGARRREPRSIGVGDLDRALADLEAHHSHFDRREALCALANQLPEGADARSLEAALDSLLTGERLVEVHRGAGPLEATYYTTPRLWALEQRFMQVAREGERAGAAVVDGPTLAAVLARHRYLSAEQAQMVRRLTTGGERVVAVAALPGSGKTTALAAAREAWAQAGYRGIGVATARSASGELSDAGVPATSITAFLIRTEELAERGLPPLPPRTVILVDEASTTSTPHAAALAELAEACEGKLVLIGDPRQIGAVGPGGLYGHLTNEAEPAVLTEIRRQRDPLDRRMVKLAHAGSGSDALDLLRMRDRLVIADSLEEALDAQVLDWHRSFASGEDAVMIARRTRDVAELNARAREALRAEGRLGEAALRVGGQEFAAGDRIITRINTPEVSNRERWEVIGVEQAAERLHLRRLGAEAQRATLERRYLERRTRSGEPAVQHAYALTTYASESKTFETAFSLLDAETSREEFVVAISRARGATTAYGVAASELTDPELGPGTREVSDAAQELRAGAERAADEYAAIEVAQRKRIAAKSASELAKRKAELEDRLAASNEPSPAAERLDALERRIAAADARLAELAQRREALGAERRPDPGQLARVESTERLAAAQLRRLHAEREGLATQLAGEARQASGLSGAERAELALVSERLTQLRRREVAAERLRPTRLIAEALGPRPKEPRRAALWNEGVDLIYGFRQRHGITTTEGNPFGPKPRDGARRRERRLAERRLARIQQRLGKQRVRSAERAMRLFR